MLQANFSSVSNVETHLIHKNKFINISLQKCCMEKVAGCWEHLTIVWHALKEARARKSNLAVIWLNITNAYGSIAHNLFLLYKDMVSFHCGIDFLIYTAKMFSVNHFLNQQLVLGIDVNGAFLLALPFFSIILFLPLMNAIFEYSIQASVPKFTTNNTTLLLLHAFMDDLSLMSTKVS